MLLCYDLAQDITYSAPFASPINAPAPWMTDVLLSGRDPCARTRFQWPTALAMYNLAAYVALRATMGGRVLRGGAFLSLVGVPEGTKITIRAYDMSGVEIPLGGNALTQRTVKLSDGSIGLYWYFAAGLPMAYQFEIRLYNDRGRSQAFAPGAIVDLGQVVLGPGVNIPHNGTSDGRVDTSKMARTIGAAISRVPRPNYAKLKVQPAPCTLDQYRGSGIEGSINYKTLLGRLAADNFALVIEDISSAANAQSTGIFGVCTELPEIAYLKNSKKTYQAGEFQFEGVPLA